MEPMGEGRPLLSVQDLESRLVFTKCKVSITEITCAVNHVFMCFQMYIY